MNSDYIFPFHNCFLSKPMNDGLESRMSPKLQEIQRKMAKLAKEADELKRLKADYQYAKKFRGMIVKQDVD